MDETVHAVGKKNEYKLLSYIYKEFPHSAILYFMDYDYYNLPGNTIECIASPALFELNYQMRNFPFLISSEHRLDNFSFQGSITQISANSKFSVIFNSVFVIY